MKTYLRLVEANATVKQYQKELGFKGGDVMLHIRFINYYRGYIKMAEEIAVLASKKRGSTLLERAKIRMEIRRVRTKYRSILSKLKAGK
jgi:hypothetical protein